MGDKSDQLKGKLKETAGKATNDPGRAQEGRRDQMKGDVKQSAEKAKDALKKL